MRCKKVSCPHPVLYQLLRTNSTTEYANNKNNSVLRLDVEKTTNLSAIAAAPEKSSKHCPWMAQKKDFIMYFSHCDWT
jgi:hypothetical protein